MNCLVRPWVDGDIDELQVREQACIVHVADFNEVWWFFPQNGQSSKNSRPHNLQLQRRMVEPGEDDARTAGITSSYTAHTIMADDLVAFQHEAGNTYPTSVPLPWAETYDLNLNSGSRLTTVKQLIPDIEGDATNLLYSLFYRTSRSVMPDPGGARISNPNASIDGIVPTPMIAASVPTSELQTPPRQVRPDGYVDFRATGRDIRLRINLIGPSVNRVSLGQHLIDSVARGDR